MHKSRRLPRHSLPIPIILCRPASFSAYPHHPPPTPSSAAYLVIPRAGGGSRAQANFNATGGSSAFAEDDEVGLGVRFGGHFTSPKMTKSGWLSASGALLLRLNCLIEKDLGLIQVGPERLDCRIRISRAD